MNRSHPLLRTTVAKSAKDVSGFEWACVSRDLLLNSVPSTGGIPSGTTAGRPRPNRAVSAFPGEPVRSKHGRQPYETRHHQRRGVSGTSSTSRHEAVAASNKRQGQPIPSSKDSRFKSLVS